MDMNDFCERRVLPVVFAFALGVVAADFAAEHREREAVAKVSTKASQCSVTLLEEVERRSRFQRMAHYAIEQGAQCREQLAVATLPLSLPIVQTKGGK